MKKQFLFLSMFALWAMVSSVFAADVDVTSMYLVNAGFNTSSSGYLSGTGSGVSLGTAGSNANLIAVTGWTASGGNNNKCAAAFEYGYLGKINNVTVPAFVSNDGLEVGVGGTSNQGCLGMSAGYGITLVYGQQVTLPAGMYKIKTNYYNNGTVTTGTSRFGFATTLGGATAVATGSLSTQTSFPLTTWTTDEVDFTLLASTTGYVQAGFLASTSGSGSNAKVFWDYVQILQTVSDDPIATSTDSIALNADARSEDVIIIGNSLVNGIHIETPAGITASKTDLAANANEVVTFTYTDYTTSGGTIKLTSLKADGVTVIEKDIKVKASFKDSIMASVTGITTLDNYTRTATFTVRANNKDGAATALITSPTGISTDVTTFAMNTLMPTTVTVNFTGNATVNDSIVLTCGSLTKKIGITANYYPSIVPESGVRYNIIQTASGLPIGTATGTDVAVMTAANVNTQAFTFVPVSGKADTYYLLTDAGMYLTKTSITSYTVNYTADTTALTSEWLIQVAGLDNSFRLKSAWDANSLTFKYLASDLVASGSLLYSDKANNNANGIFKLVKIPFVTTTGTIGAMSAIANSTTDSKTITVSGSSLQGDITLGITGTNADQFSVSPTTLTQSSGTVGETTITVTYTPTETKSSHVATLTISSPNAVSRTFDLTASSLNTGVDNQLSSLLNVVIVNGKLTVTGADSYVVYNIQGIKVADVKVNTSDAFVALKSGTYIVKAAGNVQKVLVN